MSICYIAKDFYSSIDITHRNELPNGMRYLRWGGDGEAVQPENDTA
jgi:hypothetical protein